MRDQLKWVLMACVGLLTLLWLFGGGSFGQGLAYALLPTLPLLAALYAMQWVKGEAYRWWFRFAVPWTIASMCAVLITPTAVGKLEAKSLVSTLAVLVLSTITLVILYKKVILPHYHIAQSKYD